MSYNRRMSMIPQGRSRRKDEDNESTQHRRVSSVQGMQQSRSRKKEAEADSDVQLQPNEIVERMQIYFDNFSKADLEKPNAAKVQEIFEYFTEKLLGSSRRTVVEGMQEAAMKVYGKDGGEDAVENADVLIGFYREVKRLLRKCGVNDFNLNDLLRPTEKRLMRNLSHVLDLFALYESQRAIIEGHFDQAEPTLARIVKLQDENDEFDQQVKELKRNMTRIENDYNEKKERNRKLRERIQPLENAQAELRAQKEKLEKHDQVLTEQIGQGKQELETLCEKTDRLQIYLDVGPLTLQAHVTELREAIDSTKANVTALERKRRALQTSADSFDKVTEQLKACIRIMREIGVEREGAEQQAARSKSLSKALAHEQKEDRELDSRLASLERQPSAWEEQIRRLDDQMAVDRKDTMQQISDLRKTLEQLMRDNDKKKEELQQKKMRVENIKNMTGSLRDAIARDIEAARNEYIQIESHINAYIDVMEQVMDDDLRPSRRT